MWLPVNVQPCILMKESAHSYTYRFTELKEENRESIIASVTNQINISIQLFKIKGKTYKIVGSIILPMFCTLHSIQINMVIVYNQTLPSLQDYSSQCFFYDIILFTIYTVPTCVSFNSVC